MKHHATSLKAIKLIYVSILISKNQVKQIPNNYTVISYVTGFWKIVRIVTSDISRNTNFTVQLSHKVTSTRELVTRNLHASREYTQGYSPVKGL